LGDLLTTLWRELLSPCAPANLTGDPAYLTLTLRRELLRPEFGKGDGGWVLCA
jgi:hypothetical protein